MYTPNRPLDTKKWFLLWNHYRNPFGNWHEPLPYPERRRIEAPENDFLAFLWWQFWRNPLHNLTHFNLGHVPIGARYEWIEPVDDIPDKKLFWRLWLGYSKRGSLRRIYWL